MRKAKFYKDDGQGGLICAIVTIADTALQNIGTKTVTMPRAESVMARLGFRLKKSLPPELRRRIPAGGMKGAATLGKIRKVRARLVPQLPEPIFAEAV